jgi:FtsP/CotA-like multicopper oxidase with cupredoxin domain/peroxiredoxin
MPEEWRLGDDYVLRVQKKRIHLPGAVPDGGPEEVDVITYNGRLVGPTIRVRRGTTLKIKLVNELPAAEVPALAAPEQEEPPHDLYTTNLHLHGLHVSPAGSSDNVFRSIPAGSSYQYRFAIPTDHPAGTFWYHPHKHGSVAYQMANGMAGALIVEGDRRQGERKDLDDVPEIAAARERILVLQQLIFQRDKQGVGWVAPEDVYNEPPRPNAYEVTAINGEVLPTCTMQPKEVQRWRIIHAGRAGFLELYWYDDKDREMQNQAFGEIAVDGLPRGALWLRRTIPLHPGNRSDFLVKAPATPGTYYLTAVQEDESSGGETRVRKRLVKIVVSGPERPMNFPTSAQLAACRPFPSIDAAECTVKRNVVFQYDDKKKLFHINGQSFGQQTGAPRAVLGTSEEWTLSAEAPPPGTNDEPHPFHIHVNPFQVIQVYDGRGVRKVNEWRDTVAITAGMKTTIRLRFRDFSGETVFHCHTLDHEDQGMMHTIQIVDPKQPDAATADPDGELIDCRVPAPALPLSAADGTKSECKDIGHRPVILVFFRGTGCVHCLDALRKLVREAESLGDTDVALVAISSDPIKDVTKTAKSLGPALKAHLSLVVDEDHAAFRAYGCYADGPQHGVFLIDKGGTIRARYVGEAPFADARAVCDRVRQIVRADHK